MVSDMGIQYSQGFLFHKPMGFPENGEGLPETIDLTELRLQIKASVSDAIRLPEAP